MSIKGILERNKEKFSKTDKKVADYILLNIEGIKRLTSLELATEIGVGQSTIIKFVKKIGFKGYNAFKEKIIEDLVKGTEKIHHIHADIAIEDSMDIVLKKIVASHIDSIEKTIENIRLEVIDEIVEAIDRAKRIVLLGTGSSSQVASDFEQKLLKLGKLAFHSSDNHVQGMQAATLSDEDLILVISHSGKTGYIKRILDSLPEKKKPTVVILTNYPESNLGKMGDIVISTLVNNNFIRSSALSSRIAQLTIIDSIYIGLFKKNSQSAFELLDKSREIITNLNK